MTNYKKGDVILALFPDSNLQTAKKRPVLIVQADDLKTNLPQVIVAMITSNLSRKDHQSRVFIELDSPIGKASGLLTDSVIATDNLATLDEIYLQKTWKSLRYERGRKSLDSYFRVENLKVGNASFHERLTRKFSPLITRINAN
jgi:mRNA interferase MazF